MSPQPDPPAEELFSGWLAQRETTEVPDFESLCRAHPARAIELRKLHAEWSRIRSLMSKAGLGVAPVARGSLAKQLAEQYGSGVDPHVSLHEEEWRSNGPPTSQLLERLKEHALKTTRYRLHGEIARGGMGAILSVWDEDLRRNLAMKVILGKAEPAEGRTPPVDRRLLARFLEEAQVTGQLDHPGIVPVHELGLDAEGRVYFTMKLVKGRDLKQIFDLVCEEREGWNEARALGVILKVCEAMAYAHQKGVIHRDLKPANVMVGSYGEVFVMDWGLARVLGQKDAHDLRLQPLPGTSSLRTERREERQDAPDSPLLTMDGDVVGTPCYMPPEQARGEIENLSPRSDVYSIGAMLYHLLARQMPYCPPGGRMTNRTVLGLLLHGPPTPIRQSRKDVPVELGAISERAMAREPGDRYPNTQALAEDLRAYLEGRVVRAYEAGPWAEAKKWVGRNRSLAASVAAAIVLLVGGVAGIAYVQSQGRRRAEDLSRTNALLAEEAKAKAEEALRREKEARWQSYVARLVAAEASLQAADASEAKRQLDSCDEDLRNWEWRHLRLGADLSVATLRHEKGVRDVAFSQDGSRITTLGADWMASLWNAATGERWDVPHSARGTVLSLDGTRIASELEICDAITGEFRTKLAKKDGKVRALAFSSDGSRIATGCDDGTTFVWDTSTGTLLAELRGQEGNVSAVALSANGSRVASGNGDGEVLVWNMVSGNAETSLRAMGGGIQAIAFSPDGSNIASASGDGTVRLWNATSGELLAVMRGHRFYVTDVCFNNDGTLIASASSDRTIRTWNGRTGEPVATLLGHDDTVDAVAFSPDGRLIASASRDGSVRLWEAAIAGPTATLKDAYLGGEFSPDGNRIASWEALFDAASAEPVISLSVGRFLAFSSRGNLVACSEGVPRTVTLCDAVTGEPRTSLEGGWDMVGSAVFSPDGVRIAAADSKAVRQWDVATSRLLGVFERGAYELAFSPDGTLLALACVDKKVRLLDALSMKLVRELLGHEDSVFAVAFSPSGSQLASGCRDGSVRLWDTTSGVTAAVLQGHTRGFHVRAVAFSPDGSRLASGSDDTTIRLWDVATAGPLVVIRGIERGVGDLSFSPDGTRIAAAGFDGRMHLLETSIDSLRRFSVGVDLNERAENLIRSSIDHVPPGADLSGHLLIVAGVPEELRQRAIHLLSSRGEDYAYEFEQESFDLISRPGGTSEQYARALRLAEVAERLDPDNDNITTNLAAALCRAGRPEEALSKLGEVDGPLRVVIAAMAHQQLGHRSEALGLLGKLRKLLDEHEYGYEGRLQELRREAEELLEPKSDSSAPR